MNLESIDYRKLVPAVFILFVAILGVIFYFFARAYDSDRSNTLGTYSNPQFKVEFNYPGSWNEIGGYDYDRYEGATGFFAVSGAGGEGITLDQMTRDAYSHTLRPYGEHPILENVKIDGQPGKLILPSEDQDPSMKGQAELIVLYPMPITIGGETYHYFILWADKENIKNIIPTITFRQ